MLANIARILEREGLADHPAHRQPDPVAAIDAQRAQQPVHVVGEHVERVVAGGRVALAVAAGVEAQHLVVVRRAAPPARPT